jgi:hypothetical protein
VLPAMAGSIEQVCARARVFVYVCVCLRACARARCRKAPTLKAIR